MQNRHGIRLFLIRALLALMAIIMLLPMVQTFLYSFSSIPEMKAYMKTRGNRDEAEWMDAHLSPHMFSLGQYEQILIKDNTVLQYFINSVIYAAAILAGQALVLPAMAFGLSKFRFRGRETLFFLILMLMLLPFQVTMVPNVLTLRFVGLLNTVWAVILPMVFAPFYIFLLRQYMIALPDELLEASSIDGAGPFRSFLWIVLPVCRPVLGAAAALSFADSPRGSPTRSTSTSLWPRIRSTPWQGAPTKPSRTLTVTNSLCADAGRTQDIIYGNRVGSNLHHPGGCCSRYAT